VLANKVGSAAAWGRYWRDCLCGRLRWFGALPRSEAIGFAKAAFWGRVQAALTGDLMPCWDAAADALWRADTQLPAANPFGRP